MIRHWIYKSISQRYIPNQSSPALKLLIQLLEKVMGHTTFSYQGIRLWLGPFGDPDQNGQWEEFFYHPDHNQPLELTDGAI